MASLAKMIYQTNVTGVTQYIEKEEIEKWVFESFEFANSFVDSHLQSYSNNVYIHIILYLGVIRNVDSDFAIEEIRKHAKTNEQSG